VQRAISTSGDPRTLVLTSSDLDYGQKKLSNHTTHDD
jgi:hypothetical protein